LCHFAPGGVFLVRAATPRLISSLPWERREELGRILPTYPELVLNGIGSVKDEGRSLRERSDRPTDLVFALGEEEELT
jgi:hypothetical protein